MNSGMVRNGNWQKWRGLLNDIVAASEARRRAEFA
jgi:hypothetical protein